MTTAIEPRQDELDQLYSEIFGEEEHHKAEMPSAGTYPELPDDTLILKAKLAKNGNDFTALWDGSTLGYNSDDSAADMALMDMLAFWTGGNASQMERLFSRSGLGQRDKWRDRSDYRERTIQRAISDATEFYEPRNDGGNDKVQEDRNAELLKARELLKDLPEKVKVDPGVIYDPDLLEAIREIYNNSPSEWVRIKKILLHEKISIRDLVKELKEGEDEDTPSVENPFIELDNGKLVEMVVQDGIAKFAVYDPASQNVTYVSELEKDSIRIIPPFKDEIFLKGYVTLSSKAEEYGNEINLYREIQAFVHKYLEVSEDYESIACFYPMLTWVHDVMSVIAYLRAKGDWGVGKSRFLEVFRAICYRAISTTGAMSEAPIFRIMDKWKGTMIIDEGDLGKSREASAAMEKILNCGFERNKPIIRCNPNKPDEVNVFDPFGPKIIATRYEFRDKALESRCFSEIMKEARRIDVPIELPPEFYDEALHLRNKLLMYRFRNRRKIKERSERGEINLDTKGLPKRIQQAARPISVILADHPDLLATLKMFLEIKAKALVAEASETTEGYLVRVLAGMDTTRSEDKKKLVWDTGYGSIIDFIKSASGNYKLTVALVRSRAASLGFKTEKSQIQGDQKRRITCEISVFESLKKRYIPDRPVDDVDDLDDDEGAAEDKCAKGHPDNSSHVRVSFSGGDIDRPDRPDCQHLDGIKVQLQQIDVERKAKEAHDRGQVAKYTKKSIDRHHCMKCGKNSEGHSFIYYYNNGESGYICTSCSMGQTTVTEPVKPDSQTTLNIDEEAST